MQDAADFFQRLHQICCITITQIMSQNQIVAAFFHRAFCYVHESRLVRPSAFAEPLGNVGSNRNGCSSERPNVSCLGKLVVYS